MTDYKELYNLYEENAELHPEIPEARAADERMSVFLRTLDSETAFQLDLLIGQIVRAYEMQGFLFGENCARSHA